MGDEYVYGGQIYGFWSQWKTSNNIIICVVSALLLFLAIFKSKTSLKKITVGMLLSPVMISTTILSGLLGFYLLSTLSGKIISWPGIEWPYRLLLLTSISIGGLIGVSISRKFTNKIEMIFGAWVFWLIASLLCSVYFPDAANTLILPLIFSSFL